MHIPFKKSFIARWPDMDFNPHFRNTAFLDDSGDVRMHNFSEQGFPMRRFEELAIGPVIRRDEATYFKEIHLLEPFTVELWLDGLSADRGKFRPRNEFLRESGQRAATVVSDGGWLSLRERKLVPAPSDLRATLAAISKSETYQQLT